MNSDEESDSDVNLACTPPAVTELAKENILQLLPAKSRERYQNSFDNFMKWRDENRVKSFSENVLLAYFGELSKKIAPNTLWTQYSMLKSTLYVHQNIDISKYQKIKALLKRKSEGYKPTKSKTLTPREINKFLVEAPDDRYLLLKVILVIGISGACRKQELLNLKTDDIQDLGSAAVIKIPDTKTKRQRTFTITGDFYNIFKKYALLRPPAMTERRFFVNYQNKKCRRQVVGINKIGGTPKQVATFLHLEQPELYTGHCYRRSLVNAGGDITALKRHGGWRSTTVAEGYIEESLTNKMKVADMITNSVTEQSTSAITEPRSTDALDPPQDVLDPPPEFSSSTVQDQMLHASKNSINFFNCHDNTITINVFNEIKK